MSVSLTLFSGNPLLMTCILFLLIFLEIYLRTYKTVEKSSLSLIERPRSRNLENIFYLHVPKCGSSVANVLFQYGCPSFPRNESTIGPWSLLGLFNLTENGDQIWIREHCGNAFTRFASGHSPLPGDTDEAFWENNNVVSFLRDPMERIISGFLHNFHTCGDYQLMNLPFLVNYRTESGQLNFTSLFSDQNRADLQEAYRVYWNCVRGCATKMILGSTCGDNYSDNSTLDSVHAIPESVNRLLKFAFVGLTDEWERSVQLWRSLFGGNFSDVVYLNTRPSQHSEYKYILRSITQEMGLVDIHDATLFDVAKTKFDFEERATACNQKKVG